MLNLKSCQIALLNDGTSWHSLQQCPSVPSSTFSAAPLSPSWYWSFLGILRQKLRVDTIGHRELSEALHLWVPRERGCFRSIVQGWMIWLAKPKDATCILWEVWEMFSITSAKRFLHILLSLHKYPIRCLFPLPWLVSLCWSGLKHDLTWLWPLFTMAGSGRQGGEVGLQDQSILLSRSPASLDELYLPPYLQLSSSLCERIRWNIKVTLSDNKEHS